MTTVFKATALEPAPSGALCAVHEDVRAEWICGRCGNYACLECAMVGVDAVRCRACLDSGRHDVPLRLRNASLFQRFLNAVIDLTFGSTVSGFVLGIVLGFVATRAGWNGQRLREALESRWFGFVAMSIYYLAFEGLFQTTLGKLVTGTRVMTVRGKRPAPPQLFLRTLLRFIPFEPFSFFGSDAGWHDRWSGTCVVRVRGAGRPFESTDRESLRLTPHGGGPATTSRDQNAPRD